MKDDCSREQLLPTGLNTTTCNDQPFQRNGAKRSACDIKQGVHGKQGLGHISNNLHFDVARPLTELHHENWRAWHLRQDLQDEQAVDPNVYNPRPST
eukprot:3034995-Amphidinium_carterae.1